MGCSVWQLGVRRCGVHSLFVFILCTRYWHSIWYAAYTYIHIYIHIYIYDIRTCCYMLTFMTHSVFLYLSLFGILTNHSSHLLAFAASHDRSSTLMSQTSVSIPCALFVFLSFLCCVLLFNTLSTSFGI